MKKNRMFISFFSLFLLTASFCLPNFASGAECVRNGKRLYGKVQEVTSSPDLKVQIVNSFADLHVEKVTSFPDKCGKWQMVNSSPDLKIQYVTSFPDIKVKFVKSFPGMQ